MTRPVPQLKLRPCAFTPENTSANLFRIDEGGDLIEAMRYATDLAGGIARLCGLLDESINNGESAHCAEVRAIGFLGSAVEALVRSSVYGLKASLKEGGE